jgi:DUF4097 and DUF4098 domain-containing protein YvlB
MRNPTKRVALAALLVASSALSASAQEGSFQKTLNVSGPVTLTVRTDSGSISVRRGSSESVAVKGTVRPRKHWLVSGDHTSAIRAVEQNPPITQSGNVITLDRPADEATRRAVSISYEVTVPANTEVNASTGSGHVSVDGVDGSVGATTGSGAVEVSNVKGKVKAKTGSGSVKLDGVGAGAEASTGSGGIEASRVAGGLDASTGSGGIAATLAGAGGVKAHTGSGSISIGGVAGALDVSTGSGSVDVNGTPQGDWSVRTSSGGIDVDLPAESGFRLDARTSSGSINVDHPLTMKGEINRRAVSGTVRGGGSLLTLSTASGSIQVR